MLRACLVCGVTCCKCLYASVFCVCTPPAVGMHVSLHCHHVSLLLWAGALLLSSSVLALGDKGESDYVFSTAVPSSVSARQCG